MMSSSSAKSGINAAAGDPSPPSRAAPDPKPSDMFRYNIFKNVGPGDIDRGIGKYISRFVRR